MTDLLRGSQGLALFASTTQRPQPVRDTNGLTIGCPGREIPVVWPGEVNFMRDYYIDTDKRGPTYFVSDAVPRHLTHVL